MADFNEEQEARDVIHVSGLYEDWFLDYASYVILERAVPSIEDGLKPVQRRILHAMKEMDDGRFNKVANIIGSAMQYHPHGDASISEAVVNLGQKDLLIETQGNWGDVSTGDSAAASRYIEARLSKFALEVLFNAQTTEWQLAYDGRKKEPVTLPAKFPLLLAQGVEGIAVGLSTKILPHNFIELVDASIAYLKRKDFNLFPDFITGGKIDVKDYNQGERGGKVRVRATIEPLDNKTLVITDIPFSTTTTNLIDSIVKANDKGKIRIKKVVDNTAKNVEIVVHLAPGQSPDLTTDALFAFTDCELSISTNACVIIDDKPRFLSVKDILKLNTDKTVDLLKQELEIKKNELQEKILFSSLEKIFVENRIYRDIEECETWEAVIGTIDEGLEPFKPQFYREITGEDIVRLTEIRIKRISKYDSFKADDAIKRLEEALEDTNYHLAHLIDYAINYYINLKTKYGKGRERKTEIQNFDSINATVVAANNQKLYVDRKEGFVGYGLKKDEFVSECSDIDDIIAFRADGKFQVVRVQEKVFVGKDIIHVGIFKKNDERMVYNLAYLDGASGRTMVKRFQVLSITRDKPYDLTKGDKKSKVLYFTANPNGEAEIVTVYLTPGAKARNKVFDFDFATLDIKGRSAGGNILTRYPVRKIRLKSAGTSTLGGLDIWYDEVLGRLNNEERGKYLGNFDEDDRILALSSDGTYELTNFELTNRYDPKKVLEIDKFNADDVITAIHFDGGNKNYYLKRFHIETSGLNKPYQFITEHKGSRLLFATKAPHPKIQVINKKKEKSEHNLKEMIDVKGWRAMGNKFPVQDIKKIELIKNPDQADSYELEQLKNEIREAVEKEKHTDDNGQDKDDQLGLFKE